MSDADGVESENTGIADRDGNGVGSADRDESGVIVPESWSLIGQIGASGGHAFSSLLQHFDSGQMFVIVAQRINSGLQQGKGVVDGVPTASERQ